jgi:hypothetical protein
LLEFRGLDSTFWQTIIALDPEEPFREIKVGNIR